MRRDVRIHGQHGEDLVREDGLGRLGIRRPYLHEVEVARPQVRMAEHPRESPADGVGGRITVLQGIGVDVDPQRLAARRNPDRLAQHGTQHAETAAGARVPRDRLLRRVDPDVGPGAPAPERQVVRVGGLHAQAAQRVLRGGGHPVHGLRVPGTDGVPERAVEDHGAVAEAREGSE